MAAVAAYIDGFNLYYGLKTRFEYKYLWLDVVELVRQLRPEDDVVQVRYFSAIVKKDSQAAENQARYIEALKARNGSAIDVRLGRFKHRRIGRCRECMEHYKCACPDHYRSFEEKETDVALGAMMVADAAVGVGEISVLISADSDFRPAIEATRIVDAGRTIIIALPPGKSTPSSRLSVGVFKINESALRASRLPQVVTSPDGQVFRRPEKWA